MMIQFIEQSLLESQAVVQGMLGDPLLLRSINEAGTCLINALQDKKRIFVCGNGGSMSDAMHFAEELTGRYRQDRQPFPAIAISDSAYISCVANDYGYEQIFSRFLEAHADCGDVLVAISTSGSSANVVRAAKVAQSLSMRAIGLTGNSGGVLAEHVDFCIAVKAGPYADRIQEAHIKILHVWIELIERQLCPGHYGT